MGKIGTIGMFDGVHSGHSYVLEQLVSHGKALNLKPQVVTFSRHPLEDIAPEHAPARICSNKCRKEFLQEAGVEVVETDFSKIRHMSAGQYLRALKDKGFEALVMGFNNHIGVDRLSAQQAAALDIIKIIELPPATAHANASSSSIRQALREHRLDEAAELLGHSFSIEGTVVHGQALGRRLGFPTANVKPDEDRQILPGAGVYAVRAIVDGIPYPAMANIGSRPTVQAGDDTSVEVNIFDFDKNIYGSKIKIEFVAYIRPEKKFDSIEALRSAIEADKMTALGILV